MMIVVFFRPCIQSDMQTGNTKAGCTDPEAAAWLLQAAPCDPSKLFQQGMLLFLGRCSKKRAQMTVAHASDLRFGHDKDCVTTYVGKRDYQVGSGASLQHVHKRRGIRRNPLEQVSLDSDMLVRP